MPIKGQKHIRNINGLHPKIFFNCALHNAPYIMRSRAHARHRGLIARWEGDTKREKEDERLKIASGTVLSNNRVRSRLLINLTLWSCSRLKNNKVLAPFGKNFYGITLRLLVSTLVRLEV